jgi:hypothetical protein
MYVTAQLKDEVYGWYVFTMARTVAIALSFRPLLEIPLNCFRYPM